MGMVHIKFDNGVFAVLDPSWSRNKSMPAGGDVAIDIIGKKGMLSIDLFAQKNDLYTLKTGKGVRSYWGDNMNEGMVRGFVSALLEGKEVPVSGVDGMRAAEIALAAYASSACGQPVAVVR
jgi:predicted dehydrogenase